MNLVVPVQVVLVLHAHHVILDISLHQLVHVYLAVVQDITHNSLTAINVIIHALLVLVLLQTHVLVVSMDIIIQLI